MTPPIEEEPHKSELWGEDCDEVESLSDAGSVDSLESDHEVTPLIAPLPPGRESMLNAFSQLGQRYGATEQQEDGGGCDYGCG